MTLSEKVKEIVNNNESYHMDQDTWERLVLHAYRIGREEKAKELKARLPKDVDVFQGDPFQEWEKNFGNYPTTL